MDLPKKGRNTEFLSKAGEEILHIRWGRDLSEGIQRGRSGETRTVLRVTNVSNSNEQLTDDVI